jgi:hypothetical protein
MSQLLEVYADNVGMSEEVRQAAREALKVSIAMLCGATTAPTTFRTDSELGGDRCQRQQQLCDSTACVDLYVFLAGCLMHPT